MGLPPQKRRYSIDEYVRMESDSVDKHEYHDGEILAMAGGTPEHSTILVNMLGELRSRLKGKSCRPFESNLRIRVWSPVRYFYPDASVVCGPLEYDPDDPTHQSVLNPRVIVEVLSPSIETYDRGEKFDLYRKLESLQEYVLVHQHSARVETYLRQSDGAWAFPSVAGLDATAALRSLKIDIPLAEIYADVALPLPPVEPIDPREKL